MIAIHRTLYKGQKIYEEVGDLTSENVNVMFKDANSDGFAYLSVIVVAKDRLAEKVPVRQQIAAWGLTKNRNTQNLVNRLTRAIYAGAVLKDAVIKNDVHGDLYVSCDIRVFAKHLNADLKKLGY